MHLYHRSMLRARPSLAWKIATANILLALFAVLLAGMLQYRKEQRILATAMRQELAPVVTSGALLIDGARVEDLTAGHTSESTSAISQIYLNIKSRDEVGELANSFNQMVRRLALAGIFRQASSGAAQLVEDIIEEIGRTCHEPPEDDLRVAAVTWTPQAAGVEE